MPPKPMQAVYYRSPDGSEPVPDLIDGLSARDQRLVVSQIKLLNRLTTTDPPLTFPQSSQVEGKLRELRCHCRSASYRVLYRRDGDQFILLHMFRKKTKAIPPEEITRAQKRWEDFRARMDTPHRRSPRAGGHRAP